MPTGAVAADTTLPLIDRGLSWLAGGRLPYGEAMPDRAALIEEHIPELRRFAEFCCAEPGAADDLAQDTLERFCTLAPVARGREFARLAVCDPLQPLFDRSASIAAARSAR